MARTLQVDMYEKTFSHCPNCKTMEGVFRKWEAKTDSDVSFRKLSIEETPEIIQESKAQAAPIFAIYDADTEEISYVSGLNPDALIDYLEGDDALWGED